LFDDNTGSALGESGTSRGGALAVLFDLNQELVVSGTNISRSQAATGGAVFAKCLRECTVSVMDSVLRNNTASIDGGAFALADVGGTVERTLLEGNTAAKAGGGMFLVLSAHPFVARDCVFANNNAVVGGGVHVASSAKLDFVSSQFMRNHASFQGGALSIDGTSTLTDTVANSNSATVGGGAILVSGSAIAQGFNASGNRAGSSGGALLVSQNAQLNASMLLLTNNYVTDTDSGSGGGGAIAITDEASAVFTDLTAVNNSAPVAGGAVLLQDRSNTTMIRAVLRNNSAAQGGAMAVTGCAVSVLDSRFESKMAKSDGGALYLQPSSSLPVQVMRSVASFNTAQRGGGIFWDLSNLNSAILGLLQQVDVAAAQNTAVLLEAGNPLQVNPSGAGGGVYYNLPAFGAPALVHQLNASITAVGNNAIWGPNTATSPVRVTVGSAQEQSPAWYRHQCNSDRA
jgi:hypothetical protein